MLSNAQLLIKDASRTFLKHVAEPDRVVDWGDVLKVVLSSPTAPQCPVCLAPPAAARVTRCGHVYCLPCILRHLSSSPKGWQNCPMCDELVHIEELRSVSFRPKRTEAVGGQAKMTLVRRTRGLGIVLPAKQWSHVAADPALAAQHPAVKTTFLRVFGCNEDDVEAATATQDRCQLEELLAGEDPADEPAIFFLQRALRVCQRKLGRDRLDSMASTASTGSDREGDLVDGLTEGVGQRSAAPWGGGRTERDPRAADAPLDSGRVPAASAAEGFWPQLGSAPTPASGADEGQVPREAAEPEDDATDEWRWGEEAEASGWWGEEPAEPVLAHTPETAREVRHAPDGDHFFFQSVDGSLAFLHSVNVKALKLEFGSLAACPFDELEAPVLEIERHVVTDEVRRRFRHLDHLPLDSEYALLELELSGVVGEATLATLAADLEQRRTARRRRNKAEKRHTSEVQRRRRQEEKQVRDHSGNWSRRELPPDWDAWVGTPAVAAQQTGSGGGDGGASVVEVRAPTRGAFSRAVGGIMSDPTLNPPLPSARSSSAPADASGSTWGPSLGPAAPRPARGANAGGDEYAPPPRELSFGSDAARALAAGVASHPSGGGGGKGRKKKLVLLTSSGGRRGT